MICLKGVEKALFCCISIDVLGGDLTLPRFSISAYNLQFHIISSNSWENASQNVITELQNGAIYLWRKWAGVVCWAIFFFFFPWNFSVMGMLSNIIHFNITLLICEKLMSGKFTTQGFTNLAHRMASMVFCGSNLAIHNADPWPCSDQFFQ